MKQTLFVVGAGASTDFGFPLGDGLAERIRIALDEDFGVLNRQEGAIAQALAAAQPGINGDAVRAARDLRGALTNYSSIDRALHTRREDLSMVRVGKIAIADQILQAERSSFLPKGNTNNRQIIHEAVNASRATWIAKLLRALLKDHSPGNFDNLFGDVKFIVFNYDRCIEQYLYYALQEIGSLPAARAHSIVAKIPIVHVYGSLGEAYNSGPGARFGDDERRVFEASQAVRIFTEGAEAGIMKTIKEMVKTSPRIVFLGFGFDPLNIDVLYPNGSVQGQEMIGTAYLNDRSLAALFSRLSERQGISPDFRCKAMYCAPWMQSAEDSDWLN